MLICAGLFLFSALVYVVRVIRSRPRIVPAADEQPGRLVSRDEAVAFVRRAAPVAVVAVVALTIAAGLINHFRRGYELGTPLPPFLMSWKPDAPAGRWRSRWWWRSGAAWAAPWAIERVRSGAAFAALGYVVTLAVGLSVRAAQDGHRRLVERVRPRTGRSV